MKVVESKELREVEVVVKTYIADDGREFDDAKECELYEADLKKQELKRKLELILTCKEMDGYAPADGGEYYESHEFRWYLPKTQEEADTINKYYELDQIIQPDAIGDWVCIEAYNLKDPTDGTYAMSVKYSVDYVQDLFNALGYDVTISKR